MKHTSLPAMASAFWIACFSGRLLLAPALAASPLDLNTQPSFDFGSVPSADPWFTPGILGLTTGQPGFNALAQVSALKVAIDSNFPAGAS